MTNHQPAPAAAETLDAPQRPALDGYLHAWRISTRRFGAQIGRSHEYVRRLCLPFGDDRRIDPDAGDRAKIELATSGKVPAGSFDAPDEGPAPTAGSPP